MKSSDEDTGYSIQSYLEKENILTSLSVHVIAFISNF